MTQRVPVVVACTCGYRGPSVVITGQAVCPICHTPADPTPAPSSTAAFLGPPAAPSPPTVIPRPAVAAGDPPAPPLRYRIPCPRGHVVKAGEHMLGQQVVCPECNELFLIRREDSVEYRKAQEKTRRAAEERMAKLWLSRAILAAVFIVASLVGMIALSFAFRPPLPPPPAEPPSAPAPAAQTE